MGTFGRSWRAGPTRAFLTAAGYVLYLPILTGFALHSSPVGGWRVFGKYSPAYAGFLLVLVALGAAIPWLARSLSRPTVLGRPKGDSDGTPLVIGGWRKVWFVCAAWGLSLLAAVVIVEAVNQAPGLFRSPGGRDRRIVVNVLFDKRPKGDLWNSRGFYGPELTIPKPPGTYRIIVLGGSTTFLPGVEPEEWYSTRLARSLQASRPAWKIELVNAACGHHNSFHSLVKYVTILQDFEPDLVIVMHAVNDMEQGVPNAPGSVWPRSPFARDYAHDTGLLGNLVTLSDLSRPEEPLWMHSVILRSAVTALDRTFYSDLRARGRRSSANAPELSPEVFLHALPSFRRNLRTLGELVLARGGKFVIQSQPTMYRPGATGLGGGYLSPADEAMFGWLHRPDLYREALIRAFRAYNDASRDVAAELGVPFVDLEAAVPPQYEYFHGYEQSPIHMNSAGCTLAAKALHEKCLPLVPEKPPESVE